MASGNKSLPKCWTSSVSSYVVTMPQWINIVPTYALAPNTQSLNLPTTGKYWLQSERHFPSTLQWRHNDSECVSIAGASIVYSFVCSGEDWKETSKLRVTGLCEGNSPVSGEFPSKRASNAENDFTWWRHNEYMHDFKYVCANQTASNKMADEISRNIATHPLWLRV